MTDKKQRILEKALELFANEGYNAVSTNRIATAAKVSEGLIFRHFKNKKGLLEALMDDSQQRIGEIFTTVIFETDPHKVIAKTIEIPLSVPKEDYDYWQLQFKLKWDTAYNNPEKMKPLLDKLAWAFEQIGAANPPIEAKLLSQIIEGIAIDILQNGIDQKAEMIQVLKEKYF